MMKNIKLTEDEFLKERREVLAQWPTGKDVDLDEAVDYHKHLPPGKVLPKKLQEAKQKGALYAITGMGKATLEQQMELWKYMQDAGQAEILGTSVDSFSRVLNFEASEKGLKESLKTGRSVLNGLPVVVHGVKGIRKLMESIDLPVMLRYGSIDPRLTDEIGIAGGHTSTGPDGLYSFWNMNSKYPLERSLRIHRYVHRLAGYYEERGVPINLSSQGLYDGAAVPPSMVSAALITQILLMVEQGAKHIQLHYHLRGNLVQDVAGANVLKKLAQEYFVKLGHPDITTFLSLGLALLRYPEDVGSAFGIICANTLIAVLCGAQVNDIRTSAEAVTIPTKEDTAVSYRCAKMMTAMLKDQKIELNRQALELETEREELEVRQILDKVLELGEGDVAVGVIRSVESGVLDNPFSTSPHAACKVLGVKDSEGAVRYLDTGNLPFTRDIIDFHKGKIAERSAKRGKELDYETVLNDITSISRGFLVD